MTWVVTGSAGHLGEALVRVLREAGEPVIGIDRLASPFTTHVGTITDRDFVRRRLEGARGVFHTATLHKPHVATHAKQAFVETNVTGTLVITEEAVRARVRGVVFTSTTSTFGRALTVPAGAPAAWITEDVTPVPKNIYGVTKVAAEDVCELVHREHGLPIIVLRTSRFFPERDDREDVAAQYADANLKTNEFLYRRVDVEDAVAAHRLAMERAPALGFRKYIISATTPFARDDAAALGRDAAAVVRRYVPDYEAIYAARGWTMFPSLDRVYDNARARAELGWEPRYDFRRALDEPRSALALAIGSKGYHR